MWIYNVLWEGFHRTHPFSVSIIPQTTKRQRGWTSSPQFSSSGCLPESKHWHCVTFLFAHVLRSWTWKGGPLMIHFLKARSWKLPRVDIGWWRLGSHPTSTSIFSLLFSPILRHIFYFKFSSFRILFQIFYSDRVQEAFITKQFIFSAYEAGNLVS